MNDKLFCALCGYRIWRHADNRPLVDMYIQDRHFNCKFALAVHQGVSGAFNRSYAEKAGKSTREEPAK